MKLLDRIKKRIHTEVRQMGNRTGASFGGKPEVSPRKKRAIARRKRIEEKAWQNKSGEVKTVYRCICDKNPEACKADVHG